MGSITRDDRLAMEAVIRDLAATVINAVSTRKHHPSFGNTKASIHLQAARMDGAIGLYMVLTGQAAHAGVPVLAKFEMDTTSDRVREARSATTSL